MYPEFKRQINRVAETAFSIRPIMKSALKNQILTDDTRKYLGHDFKNYLEFWEASYSDRFFDMSTLIRLGSAIEGCLKWYYMNRKGYANIPELKNDSSYRINIFQRVQTFQNDGVINLYMKELNFDLRNIPELNLIQEAMQNRHLYAHNSGIIDDDYVDKIKRITGYDLLSNPDITQSYPLQDTYWFEPLKRIPDFIEGTRRFFKAFP